MVITDHYSLVWQSNLQNPLALWAVRLQHYNFKSSTAKVQNTQYLIFFHVLLLFVILCLLVLVLLWSILILKMFCIRVSSNPLKYLACWIEGNQLYKLVSDHRISSPDEEYIWKEFIPKQQRINILRKNHDAPTAGHLEVFKTYYRVAQNYYLIKLKRDVARYVRMCQVCQ